MLPLVREEAAACARLDKSAYLGLTAEPGCEFSDGFSSVLGHSTQLATFGFSSLTASARIALSMFSTDISSIGEGPTSFRVTSRLNFASQHSKSWMGMSLSINDGLDV